MNPINLVLVTLICSAACAYAQPILCYNYPFPYISREGWNAEPPRAVTKLSTPVPYVVIHHTYIPGICMTTAQCKESMRSMQRTHQVTNGWQDIGYNFAVGGEGSVYEGRGWEAVGAHASGINTRSIGIVLIGDFTVSLPPAVQLQTAKDLIKVGVELGYIRPDYMLIGHRQATATECPGQVLFDEIRTWDNFVPTVV